MEIQRYWSVLKRHWFPLSIVLGLVSVATALSLLLKKPIYQADGMLRFKGVDPTISLTGVGEQLGTFDPLIAENNPLNTEIKVIRSIPLIQKTIDKLDLRNQNGELLKPSEFLDNLLLSTERGTDILQISYKDPDPEVAQRAVDTLMNFYLDNHLRENRAEAVAAREFIEQQLPEAEVNVHSAEAKLRQFKEENQVANLDEEARALVTAFEDLRRESARNKAELADANAQSRSFRQQLRMSPQEAIALVALGESAGVQEVLTALQEVETSLAAERVRFHDQHPIVVALNDRKANLEALLNQRIGQTLDHQTISSDRNLQIGTSQATLIEDYITAEVRRAGLANYAATLASAQSDYQQRIAILPRLEQEQRELERQLEAAQSTYSLLLERFHETRVAEHQNVGNVGVVQTAFVREDPIAPRVSAHLATGAMAGILLSVATIVFLESKDKSIRTIKDARDLFRLTLLGLIPFHKTSDIIVQEAPSSPISEAYRMLQANLKFLSSDQPIKTIVVTSSVPREGKSAVSANLSLALAQFGHRVLLIDADMRAPKQHMLWNCLNDRGLSNLLVEQLEPSTVIHEVAPNLDLLTAGVIPPNPSVLLDSHRMANLVEQFSADYHFVIIDTPALNVAADVLILGKMSDGILLVTRPSVVDLVSASFAKEQLDQFDQKILGQVVNGVIPEHEVHSYYYYNTTKEYRTGEQSASRLSELNPLS
ncbi:MAG TPA: polysaccharide biosynthesis tyrosine autokinase [Allocoleopsis sp.]